MEVLVLGSDLCEEGKGRGVGVEERVEGISRIETS